MTNKAALVEAVLLLEVEPVEESLLAKLTKLSGKDVMEALDTLVSRYSAEEFGIIPVKIAEGWTFSPKEQFWDVLKEKYGRRKDDQLSRAALETLAIIAYSQPVTRAELENLRGVGSENIVRMLKDKNYIKEVGRKDTPGRPILYGTTREFLKTFRLGSISDLPRLDEVDEAKFAGHHE